MENKTPRQLGYRFPAEWEKLQAEAAAEKAAESTKAPVPAKAE